LAWWVVVPGAVVVAWVGGLLDFRLNHSLGVLFDLAYLAGCVGAVCLARRDALFVPMVAPPPIMAVAVGLSVMVGGAAPGKGILAVGVPLLNGFPVMALATGAAVLVGGIRVLVRRRVVAGSARVGYPR
jgi:hypothetical protein